MDNLVSINNSIKPHSMSVHAPNNPAGGRDNSVSEVDSLLNELGGGLGNRNHQSEGEQDIGKLDILLKKLIDSKQITRKQLIQKLMSVRGSHDEDETLSPNENILDAESDDEATNRVHIRDSTHRNQVSNTNNNFYKFGSHEQFQPSKHERPKSSKGNTRSSI